jgi:hypothetical protein
MVEGRQGEQESQSAMPGLLKRPYESIDEGSLQKGLDAPSEERASKRRHTDEFTNGMNGVHTHSELPSGNGVYANGAIRDPAVSREKVTAFAESIASEMPPELTHISQGFVPLSKLIERLSQDTLNKLEQIINELGDMPLPPPGPSPHAYGASGVPDVKPTQAMIKKKTKLFDFAGHQRAKFIKILVLAQWGRQSEAVSKIIDINFWMTQQKMLYTEATNWMGELKRMLSFAKQPAADLETALQVLSTGKADWISHVCFPRDRLLFELS